VYGRDASIRTNTKIQKIQKDEMPARKNAPAKRLTLDFVFRILIFDL
jgi:hypothetical protein